MTRPKRYKLTPEERIQKRKEIDEIKATEPDIFKRMQKMGVIFEKYKLDPDPADDPPITFFKFPPLSERKSEVKTILGLDIEKETKKIKLNEEQQKIYNHILENHYICKHVQARIPGFRLILKLYLTHKITKEECYIVYKEYSHNIRIQSNQELREFFASVSEESRKKYIQEYIDEGKSQENIEFLFNINKERTYIDIMSIESEKELREDFFKLD